MASIYRRNRSPYWWLKWRNPVTRRVERLPTPFRIDDERDHAKALHLRNQQALQESAARVSVTAHPFREWVLDYLQSTHGNSPRTLARYRCAWLNLFQVFLESRQISDPAQLTRAVCLAYVPWRQAHGHRNSARRGRQVSINTIILELKLLSKVLYEAVRRGYLPANPCARLGLKRDPPRPKDEMSDDQIALIEAAIRRHTARAVTPDEKDQADFYAVSFEIARRQGIRLAETYLPLADVDLDRGAMLVRGKGGKLEEITINPNLVPLFTRLIQTGRTHTYTRPKNPPLTWYKFFRTLRKQHPGLRRVSFHSTRITVISRMERAGVPENVMMRAVLHSSTTVHRVYRKVQAKELAPYWNSLEPAAAPRKP